MRLLEMNPKEKGKVQLVFDTSESMVLYKKEVGSLGLTEGMEICETLYEQMYHEILGKRVTKRAMYLLQRQDRTEEQLRRKLADSAYPQELIDNAIAYVKSFHYIDDERYARTYVRLNQERKSKNRMRMDLLGRGVPGELVESALEEEAEVEPEALIRALVEKRHYDIEHATPAQMQKMYRFLLGRGFLSSEIRRVLNCSF